MARDTTPTDRRGYERPAIGDDWATAWDDLVEDSDELAVERGPIADRPSTGAYDDALYLAVDQRTLWRWDAAASDWEAAAGLGTASDPVPGTSHFESVSTNDSRTTGTEDIIIDVPSDYPTVDEAIHKAKNVASNGERFIRVNIESGHKITTQVFLSRGDYSSVSVQAEDSTVPVDSSFPATEAVIKHRQNVISPVYDVKIDAQGNGEDGANVKASTLFFVSGDGRGIINAGRDGIFAQNRALINAYSNDFAGASNNGVYMSRGCVATLGGTGGIDVSGAGLDGLVVDRGSICRAENMDAKGAGRHGVRVAQSSALACPTADLSNVGDNGARVVSSSACNLYQAVIDGVANNAIRAVNSATVDAIEATITNAQSDAVVCESGNISIKDASVTGSAFNDIKVEEGGIVRAHQTETTSGGTPDTSNTNVSSLNSLSADGIIFG